MNEGVKNQASSGAPSLSKQPENLDAQTVNCKIDNLSQVIKENKDEIVETGKQVVEIREEIASIKTNLNFRTICGKGSVRVRDDKQVITLSNRYEVLEDQVDNMMDEKEDEVDDALETDSYIIGDYSQRAGTPFCQEKPAAEKK